MTSTYKVRCVFQATSVTLLIKAESADEAISKAQRNPFGKKATSWAVVGTTEVPRVR